MDSARDTETTGRGAGASTFPFLIGRCHVDAGQAIFEQLFLAGPEGPWLPGPIWFVLKLLVLLLVFIWMRTTLPRLRYDQLMRFGWKVLLPVATINALVTAACVVAF